MVDINYVREFVNLISAKVNAGFTITTDQFNIACDRAQMTIFEMDYQFWLETEDTTDFLKSFLKTATLLIDPTGNGQYPADYLHTSNLRYYYQRAGGLSDFVPVVEVNNKDWAEISSSQLLSPTMRFPKFCEFSDHLEIRPRALGLITFDYYSRPVKPIWAYTIVNGRQQYDPANSVQFEESEYAMNRIIPELVSYLGINLSKADLSQFSEMFKAENAKQTATK